MVYLTKGDVTCDFCGIAARCFELVDKPSVGAGGQKLGCMDCLKKGRFHFSHQTEIGSVTPREPFLQVGAGHENAAEDFTPGAVGVLLRTPEYATWQGECWLTHCNDFMIYLGEWRPKDFYEHAADGDGRGLFLEMTDASEAHLWKESVSDENSKLKDWYAAYYAFKCGHCGKLRGHWDFD